MFTFWSRYAVVKHSLILTLMVLLILKFTKFCGGLKVPQVSVPSNSLARRRDSTVGTFKQFWYFVFIRAYAENFLSADAPECGRLMIAFNNFIKF